MNILQLIMSIFTSISVALTSFFGGLAASFFESKTSLYTAYKTMTYEESLVTDEEKALARQWYEENVLFAGTNGKKPAYDFKVKNTKLSQELKKWKFEVGETSEEGKVYRGGKTTYITVTNEKRGLQATIEATFYEAVASCDWTVYIKNIADKNSADISDFYAIDTTFGTGKTTLYWSNGGTNDNEMFTVRQMPLQAVKWTASSTYGKSSDEYMPVFNLSGEKYSVVASIGWSGQWNAKMSQKLCGAYFNARQEEFDAYLLPGEEVRSPLISLSFYKSGNALKGYNVYRSFVKDCVYNENIHRFAVVNQGRKSFLNATDEELEHCEYIWHDFGWFEGVD
ncbi:MAG: hypothetical protein IJS17_02795, partial [Clostridia bacterium]|nr:hypothetical protein [Clostridia bacterium]